MDEDVKLVFRLMVSDVFWITNVAPKRKTQNLVVSCHVYLCCHPKGRDYLELVQVYMYWRSPTNENSLYVCKAIYSNLCKISATKRSWRAGSWLLTYALRSIQSADSVKCVIKNHVTVILPISMILCSSIVRHCCRSKSSLLHGKISNQNSKSQPRDRTTPIKANHSKKVFKL